MNAIAVNFLKSVDQNLVKSFHHEVQYDFFLEPEQSEVEMLRKELSKVAASGHSVRKGTYAMINEQRKRIEDLEERLAILERHICHL
jgi:Tfp pilus assembly protein PilO